MLRAIDSAQSGGGWQEARRLAELGHYDTALEQIDDTLSELAAVAAHHFGAPLAGVSLVDEHNIWLRGRYGLSIDRLDREGAFCGYAVESNQDLFEVPDTLADARFSCNALVNSAPHVRSYMAATLVGHRGYMLGTLWFMDMQPRTLTPPDRAILRALATQAMQLLELRHRAAETGLPTRHAFVCMLQAALVPGSSCDAGTPGESDIKAAAVMAPTIGYVQLGNLPQIYNLYGREKGQELLLSLADVLRNWRHPGDLLGQVDGTNFAFALFQSRTPIEDRFRELEILLARPVASGDEMAYFNCRVGVTHCLPEGGSASALLDQAAAAATQVVDDPTAARIQVYEPQQRERTQRLIALQKRLDEHVCRRLLRPHYQPQVDVRSGRIIGFEALARLYDPNEGVVAAQGFVGELANNSGLIRMIDMQVLEAVCRDLVMWLERGLTPVPVSINFARTTLMHERTVDSLLMTLEETEIPTGLICVEITESGLSEQPEILYQRARELNDCGIEIGLDDFGTGMSNLEALRSLPFSCLKADRRYVHGASTNAHIGAILRFIQGIADLFGVRLVCEGVEEEADLRYAMALGCRYFQGWYFSRDVTSDHAATLLELTARADLRDLANEPATLARLLRSNWPPRS